MKKTNEKKKNEVHFGKYKKKMRWKKTKCRELEKKNPQQKKKNVNEVM